MTIRASRSPASDRNRMRKHVSFVVYLAFLYYHCRTPSSDRLHNVEKRNEYSTFTPGSQPPIKVRVAAAAVGDTALRS